MVTILKLGGSVITEKDRPETLDGEALDAAADAIAEATSDLILVHGGGSFGHHRADRHGVGPTAGTTDAAAALDIHGAMTTLNRFVLERLHERSVPTLPVHPLSSASRDATGSLSLATGPVERMLGEGFVPVLHGDVVTHSGEGVTVLSGDEIVVSLAGSLAADRVGLCSGVPGVLDADGSVIETIADFERVRSTLGTNESTDVTGGMAGKVRALLELETPASIFGLDALPDFLAGEAVGTSVGTDRA